VRLYIPATSTSLATLDRVGALGPAPLTAFAVTPGLREWYVDDDIEELEYAAMLEAARASLRLIGGNPGVARRRIVIAADVADEFVTIRDDLDRGVVRIETDLALAWCASVHVDDEDAEDTIGAAAPLIDAADMGDAEAEAVVDDADGHELSWYATQEIPDLIAALD
jgi:hypothetical protein